MTTPLATYRLQLRKEFGFDDAAKLVPYLKALGITHLYASPFLKARAGSTHGYDIVDHAALNPEFGGEEAFTRLSDALREAGIGLILDFVPNHMGVGYADNAWWLDVLEWGQRSPYANSFDIDWEALPYRHGGGVLLPFLGKPYGDVLERGELALKYDPGEGSFSAWYYEHRFPIAPQRYGEILRITVETAGATETPPGKTLLALAALHRDPSAPSYKDAPDFKRRIAAVDGGADIIERGLSAFRGQDEAGRALLHRLLERQHYRVAYWRVAVAAINYRRFFDINDLAGLRVEDPRAFRAVHTLVARLVAEGRLQGIRLDHIDGLHDPRQYARRLRQLLRQVRGAERLDPTYVIVEKILSAGESMPELAGVSGTTGYEWLNVITYALLDDRGLPMLDAIWQDFSGERRNFSVILEEAKHCVLETMLASEFRVLTHLLARIAAGHYTTRDYTSDRLRTALELFVIEFPIYRTYVTSSGPSDDDRAIIESTIGRVRARWLGSDIAILDFLRDVITLDLVNHSGYSATRVQRFAFKLQQFTGPLLAKSLEDTAFYRYHRLLALNEVGGEATATGLPAARFHARMMLRVARSPHGLTATATHDTKRGEDARTRILALAELGEEWRAAVAQWRTFNAELTVSNDGRREPSPAHEYMLYQALIGAWPLEGIDEDFVARMQAYALKAAREGKVETSWANPDEAYENKLTEFVSRLLDTERSAAFIASFDTFARRTALIGALNSLSQLTLKTMMPGVPDFYQGTEFWDLSLVDPDNRRPIDFIKRHSAFDAIGPSPDWRDLSAHWTDGRIKLALTRKLLALRGEYADLFRGGYYEPIEVSGPGREHVLAFARTRGRDAVIIAVGRCFADITESGRHWPSRWWDAVLKLDGFSTLADVIDNRRELSPSDDVAAFSSSIPLRILQATRVPRKPVTPLDFAQLVSA